MKLSTTQDTAYLKECLAFHRKRRYTCYFEGDEDGVKYHRKQIKWFEAKLRSPLKTEPKLASAIETQARFESEEHQRYLERLELYQSQSPFKSEPELGYDPPKPAGLISRLWNRIRGL